MPERFTRLYELQNNLYSAGSPVIVAAGALLKDTQTNSVIVQLKFHSVSSVPITALKVSISAYDVAGKELEGIDEYQYLDLNIQNGQEFGSNKAIVMPDTVSRFFSIKSITVVLTNGDVNAVSLPMASLPQMETLQYALNNSELVKQYKLATNDSATYIPQESNNLWLCSCGKWNSGFSCTLCRLQKKTVFSMYNVSSLTSEMNIRLAEERRQKEEQEKLAEQARSEKAKRLEIEAKRRREQTKKTKIALAIILPVMGIVVAFVCWLYPDVIKPSVMYNEAQQLFAEAKYDDAATIFNALGNYKEAEDMATEAVFQKGCMFLNEQKFDEAITIFNSLGDYGEYKEKEMEAYYQKAMFLKEGGDIEGAIAIFTNLVGYQDSDTECVKLQYDLATTHLANGLYDNAKSIFESISSYEDSANLAMECDYQKGCHYLENAQYLDAIEVFSGITGYLDTETKTAAAYSLYYLEQGNLNYNEAKFYLAIEHYQKSNETAAAEMITVAEAEIAFIDSVCGLYELVEKVSWGQTHTIGPGNTDSCEISFNYDKGQFVVDSYIYVDEHYFAYNFDKKAPYRFEHYLGYYYELENGRLLWYEDSNNYRYFEKNN